MKIVNYYRSEYYDGYPLGNDFCYVFWLT